MTYTFKKQMKSEPRKTPKHSVKFDQDFEIVFIRGPWNNKAKCPAPHFIMHPGGSPGDGWTRTCSIDLFCFANEKCNTALIIISDKGQACLRKPRANLRQECSVDAALRLPATRLTRANSTACRFRVCAAALHAPNTEPAHLSPAMRITRANTYV